VQPHTLDFDYNGKMWVALELPGVMIQLDVDKLSEKEQVLSQDGEAYTLITKSDLVSVCIVNLAAAGVPGGWLKTRPHGFCFGARDEGQISSDYIWFTGKLTNTVGRVRIVDSECGKHKAGELEHFMLPTLGAVPIYLMLGPDLGPDKPQDVWGTCLTNNNVFRVTTRTRNGLLVGHVTEIPITPEAAERRPIVIKPQVINDKPMPYMWFSCEAGHSVARIDIDEVQELVEAKREAQKRGKLPAGDDGRCMCSKSLYSAGTFNKAVLEFDVPMTQQNMKLAGLAFDKDGNLWTQSCD
jgi:virginiamycin B lyase